MRISLSGQIKVHPDKETPEVGLVPDNETPLYSNSNSVILLFYIRKSDNFLRNFHHIT